MNRQVIGCADDDELTGAFQQMKPAPVDLGQKGGTPNLPFHITHGPPHNATGAGSLGVEKLMKEGRVSTGEACRAKLNLSHLTRLAVTRFTKDYQPSSVTIRSSATPISLSVARTSSTMPPGPQM